MTQAYCVNSKTSLLSSAATVLCMLSALFVFSIAHADMALAHGTPTKECPRIVSQAPYITRTLEWLGKAHCIVGVSVFDERKDLPTTGGMMDPDFKAIASLDPDIVFLSEYVDPSKTKPLPAVLKTKPFKHTKIVRLYGFQTIDQIVENAYTVASAIGIPDAVKKRDKLQKMFNEEFSKISAKKHLTGNVAVLTKCELNPAIIGRDSFIIDALKHAGFSVTPAEKTIVVHGDDIAGQFQRYWNDYKIGAIILLEDKLRPNCILSAVGKQIPIYPVGSDVLRSPSPKLVTDLATVINMIQKEAY